MESLTLAEIRKIISQKDNFTGDKLPFSLKASACDVKKQAGGHFIDIEFGTLYSQSYEMIRVMVMKRDEITKKIVPTGNLRAVHISLIVRLNNIEVQWS